MMNIRINVPNGIDAIVPKTAPALAVDDWEFIFAGVGVFELTIWEGTDVLVGIGVIVAVGMGEEVGDGFGATDAMTVGSGFCVAVGYGMFVEYIITGLVVGTLTARLLHSG
jgi:hypothetical protein